MVVKALWSQKLVKEKEEITNFKREQVKQTRQLVKNHKQILWEFRSPALSSNSSGVKREREEAQLSKLIDIGSCKLHVIHGAFKSACEKTERAIKCLLKGAFRVLKDSASSLERFFSVAGSSVFPLQFCAIRWMKDQTVANRLKEIILPYIVKVSNYGESLPKSSRSSSKKYDAVLIEVKDEMTVTKLSFFSYVASLLQPYLTKYQREKPMMPFPSEDLESLYKSLLHMILKAESFDLCSDNGLLRVNLLNKSNYLQHKNIHLVFETAQMLQDKYCQIYCPTFIRSCI